MTRYWPLVVLALAAGCKDREALARADSLQAAAIEQTRLAQQLAAQKDSLTTIVLDADAFITRIDSQISRVQVLPAKRRATRPTESPIEEQLERRKLMLDRVSALVDRAQATARQLAAAQKREQKLRGENGKLRDQLAGSEKLIADLGSTIERQATTINGLQLRADSLATVNDALGRELGHVTVAHNKAYYIVGTERDLLAKGVIVRTGGTKLLFKRVGRSIQPARQLKPELFTPVDQREALSIPVPDSSKRYRIVSRQPLHEAEIADRKKGEFRGNLHIRDASQFWAPSKYLIIVQL